MRLMKKFVGTLAATGALAAGATAQAPTAPSHRGCPPSFTSWDVSTQPYQVDNQVDAEGNGDRFVCAQAAGFEDLPSGRADLPNLQLHRQRRWHRLVSGHGKHIQRMPHPPVGAGIAS